MSIFNDPADEQKLYQVLRAYVEEWGAENVVVSVPDYWSAESENPLGAVRLEFSPDNALSVRVDYEQVSLSYGVNLVAV